MSWYEFLLFVHVAAAAVWLGGAFIFQVYGIAVSRGGDAAEMAQFAGRVGHLGERVFVPASLLVLAGGIGLMIEGSWAWGRLWVLFALAAFAGSFLVGLLVLTPMAKKIAELGPTTPEGQEQIRRIFAVSRVELSFLYAIAFAMTVKPTGDDMWIVLAAAAGLLVLTALFLAPLRGPRPEAAPATD